MSGKALLEAVLQEVEKTPADDSGLPVRSRSDAVRVLVVENDHGDLAATRSLLASVKAVQFDIQHAPTLFLALALLGEGIDVLLLDLSLPDSQGLARLHLLRDKDPFTPIIVLARPEARLMAVEGLNKGAQDFLLKGQVDARLLGQSILRRIPPRTRSQSARYGSTKSVTPA